jgi:hypothetical protein
MSNGVDLTVKWLKGELMIPVDVLMKRIDKRYYPNVMLLCDCALEPEFIKDTGMMRRGYILCDWLIRHDYKHTDIMDKSCAPTYPGYAKLMKKYGAYQLMLFKGVRRPGHISRL